MNKENARVLRYAQVHKISLCVSLPKCCIVLKNNTKNNEDGSLLVGYCHIRSHYVLAYSSVALYLKTPLRTISMGPY
jgi:hypothetical protein